MPPKKKIKLVKGQQRLRISTSNLQLLGNSDHSDGHESHDTEYPESSLSLSTSATTNSLAGSSSESSSHRRGTTTSWISFGESKRHRIHPWLLLKPDGVYCQYCCHCHQEVRSCSGVFVTKDTPCYRLLSAVSWLLMILSFIPRKMVTMTEFIYICVSTTTMDV